MYVLRCQRQELVYVANVKNWFKEVVDLSREKRLNPAQSVFALILFSSMDFELVDYFKTRKPQISQYSGSNFHLFTPIIYEGNLVPDGEVRALREAFTQAGIPVGKRPSTVLFKLDKRPTDTGYEPHYIAAFEFPKFGEFMETFQEFIDVSIEHRAHPQRLIRELTTLFSQPNLIEKVLTKTPLSEPDIERILHAPRVFISYTHGDKDLVQKIYNHLKSNDIDTWFDRYEILPGMKIRETVEEALRSSDALLMILSRNSQASNWINFEGSLFYAGGGARPIIPIVVDDEGRTLANNIPFLQGRHYIDLTEPPRKSDPLSGLYKILNDLRTFD